MNKFTLGLLLAASVMFTLQGCKDDSSQTTITNVGGSTAVECTGDNCGPLTTGDGNVVTTTHSTVNTGTPAIEFDYANYSATYPASVCNDLGFYFCEASERCLPQPMRTGSCPAKVTPKPTTGDTATAEDTNTSEDSNATGDLDTTS